MPIKTNYERSRKIVPYFKALSANKIAALLLLSMMVATPSYAEKAKNYGDINDEDGKYISWHKKNVDGDIVKTAHKSKSSASKNKNFVTKKLSINNFGAKNQTGYGDLDQDED